MLLVFKEFTFQWGSKNKVDNIKTIRLGLNVIKGALLLMYSLINLSISLAL